MPLHLKDGLQRWQLSPCRDDDLCTHDRLLILRDTCDESLYAGKRLHPSSMTSIPVFLKGYSPAKQFCFQYLCCL